MIENVLDLVDHVLVMTVNPGFGGQAYIPTMTDKIRKIRKWGVDRGLDFDIEVDGGDSKPADAPRAPEAWMGANCFIAGSGMTGTTTSRSGSELRTIAEAAQKGKILKRAARPSRTCKSFSARSHKTPSATAATTTRRAPRRRAARTRLAAAGARPGDGDGDGLTRRAPPATR